MTDKYETGLIKFYEQLFVDLKDKPIKLLELGIFNGDSLKYFKDYFKNGEIVGVDHREKTVDGVKTIKGNQEDILFLQQLGNENGPFDIIIDDCSHYGPLTQRSFDFLFEHLNAGGFYIIEDWGVSFRSRQFGDNELVISKVINNFDRLKLKEVRALILPEGGWVAVIKK